MCECKGDMDSDSAVNEEFTFSLETKVHLYENKVLVE
jgi:hypothetical protein